MYVMSSLPKTHQSIAGGIFQTMSRLGGAVGFGLTTAVFNAVSGAGVPSSGYYANDRIAPYAGAFWLAFGANVVGLMLCPWLRIGVQGGAGGTDSRDDRRPEEKSRGSEDKVEG